jgi:hypothetical protein
LAIDPAIKPAMDKCRQNLDFEPQRRDEAGFWGAIENDQWGLVFSAVEVRAM